MFSYRRVLALELLCSLLMLTGIAYFVNINERLSFLNKKEDYLKYLYFKMLMKALAKYKCEFE